ncbi:MAG: hypothetical protein A3D92_17450 [Bacteroidetes bacterium RIFCSPHIGHO2_02_FULL_44_7]|nr:MAG: hypothetical protein A3D92_17450 [Bacteroidetes bacterium RIFCSPHIGHO2_02_FULL_44_7]
MLREIYYLNEPLTGFRLVVFQDETPEKQRALRREHEKATTLNAISELLSGETVELEYAPGGAPLLKSHPELHLSISHSKDWYAIALSNRVPVGVDVQEMKAEGLASGLAYFMASEEQDKEWTDQGLYLIWCAKEVWYKWKRGEVESYKEDLLIKEIANGQIHGQICGEFLTCAYFFPLPTVALVYFQA